MEQEGPVSTAVAGKYGRAVAVDKKAAFMVQEFRLRIVGISEMKWLGQDVCEVESILSYILPVPGAGEAVERKDGCQCW